MPRRRHHKKKNCTQQQSSTSEEKENLPYLIKRSDTLGRYLVASRDLAEGDEIIKESALVIGPAQDSQPGCLGCYKLISDSSTVFSCNKCQWPLCSKKCKGLYKRHGHSKEECSILASCSMISTQLAENQLYNVIVPLRCLLLKEHHPDDWRILMTMEAHNDVRKQIPTLWNYNQKSVVDRIVKDWKISQFSEEEIHTVCGILEVNAFAVGDESLNLRGIYPTAFLIAHSCVCNTSHTDDEEFNIKIYSSLSIPKDDMIFVSYTNSLQGTKKRREHLKQCKFFDCDCRRCKDSTELGTYLSGIKCGTCSSGHMLSTDPLKLGAAWVCDNKQCAGTTSAHVVDNIINRDLAYIKSNLPTVVLYSSECREGRPEFMLLDVSGKGTMCWCVSVTELPISDILTTFNLHYTIPRHDTVMFWIESEIKNLNHNNIEELESSICRYNKMLHKNHYLILGMKYTLSQLYGKAVGSLIHQMSEANLERKQQICEDILQLFDVIEPGMTHVRGMTMYELHAPIMVLTIQRFEMRKISKTDLCRRLRKVVYYLRDCCRILKFERDCSHEGSIRTAAQDALLQLKSWEPVVGKL